MNLLLTFFYLALAPIFIVQLVDHLTRAKFSSSEEGVVLITGASTGIGRHAAEHLANNSRYLVLAGVRKESDAESIRQMKIGGLVPLIIDVTSEGSCKESLEAVKALMKDKSIPFYALINNAGISRKAPVEFHLIEDAERMFATNFFGALRMTQLYLPLLRESKGRIVMISSVAGFISRPLTAMYSGTKFALEGLTDGLRRECSQFGVAVSIVQPAFVKSNIFQSASENSETLRHSNEEANALMREVYGRLLPKDEVKYQDLVKNVYDKASDPRVTSLAITQALSSEYPKVRYTVASAFGVHATVLSWVIWALPDGLEDLLLSKFS